MDIAAVSETGGPLAGLAVTAAFFLKVYIETRKADRKDRKLLQKSCSAIVETMKEALAIARDQRAQMSAEIRDLRSQKVEDEARRRVNDVETEDLRLQITELKALLRAEDKSTRLQAMPSQRSSPPDAT